uniref:Uncharacterized protein n=1 Tax=Utricularia reniformis TaxID=192314 RepID=A0A1Y0B021_9LAMI|nr:hypothetical protein AEK19_MT0493 [Utricularia reniformis]ART30750.1 hypothetical protein AEK19_MT0493 [Utricularia reniformis]
MHKKMGELKYSDNQKKEASSDRLPSVSNKQYNTMSMLPFSKNFRRVKRTDSSLTQDRCESILYILSKAQETFPSQTPSDAISTVRSIVETMLSTGYGEECLTTYQSIRGSYFSIDATRVRLSVTSAGLFAAIVILPFTGDGQDQARGRLVMIS